MAARMSVTLSRWNKLRQFGLFVDDSKTLSLLDGCPFRPAFRFSAWLWWLGRGTQTWQQFANPAPHLLGGRLALLVFPRMQFWFNQRTRKHQMIVDNSDNMAPALKLLWSTQAWLFPHERLFVKAIAMLLPKAQHIAQGDLGEIDRLATDPDEPAHPWIPLLVRCMRSYDTHNGDLQPASLFDMHALPPSHFYRTTFVIGTTPHAIWLTMGAAVFGLQFRSIFAWSTFLTRWSGGNAVKTTIAFETAQDSNAQPTTTAPQPGGVIASVQ